MRKMYAAIIFLLSVIVALQGCNQTTADFSSGKLNSESMLFLIEDSTDNLVSIQMPSDSGLSDDQKDLVQGFILREIMNNYGENFALVESANDIADKDRAYTNCYINAQSRIEYNTKTIVSVVVEGLYNKRSAAHPIHFLWALNYDPETMEIISLPQRYQINAELYRAFSQAAVSDIIASCDGKWPAGWGDFAEEICSQERFLEGLSVYGDFHYYFTDDGVVISLPVPYVMGNYIEVFLPYSCLTTVA